MKSKRKSKHNTKKRGGGGLEIAAKAGKEAVISTVNIAAIAAQHATKSGEVAVDAVGKTAVSSIKATGKIADATAQATGAVGEQLLNTTSDVGTAATKTLGYTATGVLGTVDGTVDILKEKGKTFTDEEKKRTQHKHIRQLELDEYNHQKKLRKHREEFIEDTFKSDIREANELLDTDMKKKAQQDRVDEMRILLETFFNTKDKCVNTIKNNAESITTTERKIMGEDEWNKLSKDDKKLHEGKDKYKKQIHNKAKSFRDIYNYCEEYSNCKTFNCRKGVNNKNELQCSVFTTSCGKNNDYSYIDDLLEKENKDEKVERGKNS